MKKMATLSLLIVLSITTFSQEIDTVKVMTKQDYLKKSKTLKITGFVFLGIGATCFAIAALGNVSFDDLAVLVLGGAAAALISIPLFIAAGHNKRKARRAVANLKFERLPYFQQHSFALQSYPAISFKIKL